MAIEFHSLSKTFNMTGWRVGFAIGGAPMIAALGQVKANTDSGIFTAIQFAGKTALDEYDKPDPADPGPLQGTPRCVRGCSQATSAGTSRRPRRRSTSGSPAPRAITSTELCSRLLDEADVVTTPGIGFGRTADGYIRAALTVETPRLLEAVERIGKLKL